MGGAEALRQSLIFSSLGQEEMEALSHLSLERSFPPDEFIFWEGDAPDYFYVVASGRVKAVKH